MTPAHASLAAMAAGCLLLAGCNNGSGEVSLNNGGGTGGLSSNGTGRGGQAELTPQQGAKLLADIRKDPKRLQKLTLPERRYLAKAGVDVRGQTQDR